jgi:hypothetical protein
VMTALILAFGFGTYRVAQIRARHPSRRGAGALMLAALPLITTVTMGVIWHRIMFDANFERVNYDGERCYMLGDTSSEALLYCPDRNPPRNQRVSLSDPGIRRSGVTESVFTGPDQSP